MVVGFAMRRIGADVSLRDHTRRRAMCGRAELELERWWGARGVVAS